MRGAQHGGRGAQRGSYSVRCGAGGGITRYRIQTLRLPVPALQLLDRRGPREEAAAVQLPGPASVGMLATGVLVVLVTVVLVNVVVIVVGPMPDS